ncbi:phage protein [Aquitalea magnusonii]|uniref:Phage protein n=1 Tax=Aquitalea magnusonii TaxID=332411 RepID=A0A3G9GCZ5_9NEIS|nr:regulatory protein GemA [Aquitalea magnusonii]BBF84529.1 phage protein [Aquitalea magnusonii]
MTDRRKAMISKIHIARQQLQMADDSYRSLLARLADGKTSSTTLTLAQLDLVLAEFKRLGFVQKPARKHGRRPKPVDSRETLIAKIEAQLSSAGRPWDYAHSLAKRMYRVEKLEWLNNEQLQGVMVALVYDAKRHGRPA